MDFIALNQQFTVQYLLILKAQKTSFLKFWFFIVENPIDTFFVYLRVSNKFM